MSSSPVRDSHADDEALLLVESLLHELVANGTLTVDRAVAVVEIAMDVRDQHREEPAPAGMPEGQALDAILATLNHDRP